MLFQVLTLFPERYLSYVKYGLPAKAFEKKIFEIQTIQLRDFADTARKGRLDETPYGGGPGMILQIGPIHRALTSLDKKLPVILFTPRGEKLNQNKIKDFSKMQGFTLINGYYEGVDERVAENLCDYQLSLGDFILGSGDLASLCFIEAVTRLLPNYMGSSESILDESNTNNLLEYPHYTRPEIYENWKVPEILLSGNHQKIAKWREDQKELITRKRSEQ